MSWVSRRITSLQIGKTILIDIFNFRILTLRLIHFRKFFELLGNGQLRTWIDHPFIPGEKLFMWFDPTHNLKNLFNIWSSRKRFSLPTCGTEEPNHAAADFGHVVALQELEATKTVKVAHSLTSNSLYPSNIQKTSPRFALSKSGKKP